MLGQRGLAIFAKLRYFTKIVACTRQQLDPDYCCICMGSGWTLAANYVFLDRLRFC